jgi:isoleucyl-tRNA synthetase
MTPQEREASVLAFWKEQMIYRKARARNKKEKKFYMVDGPPYATGHIHMGTALNKILKDVAMRSQHMQGKDIFDRPVYDTHGVPIEFAVEKEIGSKSKKDIETYGVKKFIERCQQFATQYIDVMNDEFANLGIWMDWSNPYKTLDAGYVEVLWDALKKAYDQKLLYLGSYPVHVCPRCETAVAFNEIEYTKQSDYAIVVKFPVIGKKNTFLLIWTTTPWTLPANTGIMVHPDVDYVEVETSDGQRLILAEKLMEKRLSEAKVEYKVKRTFKGKELVGMTYDNPLEPHMKLKLDKPRSVVGAPRYVTTEDGTGLVHCAPGHGKEDYEVGTEAGLAVICPVRMDGTLTEETGKFAGGKAREIDKQIAETLKTEGYLLHSSRYNHDYPLCWRCKTPLLMLSMPQWFLRISKVRKELLKHNTEVEWFPKWAELRMKAWLEGIADWPISRERYWGTPLPIWTCNACDHVEVIGSIKELEGKTKKKVKEVHKPEIDQLTWKCECKKGEMKRVGSVFDVWFDSGVSSWAALDYLHNKEQFKKFWPGDLNIEGTDQFRGWWNSQLILSHLTFGKRPFDSINVHGLILDINKRKMSKSLGNVVAPQDVIAKHGRDALRYYLVKFSRGEDFAYNEKEFSEIQKVLTILYNVNTFINQIEKGKQTKKVEDAWILSRFANTVENVAREYNRYRFFAALEAIETFLVQDLSRTYIQMIRDRSEEVVDVLREIQIGVLKMLAAVMPFTAEHLWQELRAGKFVSEESIFLSDWPSLKKGWKNEKLEKSFTQAMNVIERGLAARDQIKIGLRWPLARATVTTPEKMDKDVAAVVAAQLNVKEVVCKKGEPLSVELDTNMTPELEGEGFARESARRVQAERKKRGLVKKDRINLHLSAGAAVKKLLLPYADFIAERTGADKVSFTDDKKHEFELEVRGEKIAFSFVSVTRR